MKIKDKVLVVEDEQSISNFISTILTANDYDALTVRTGEEALTMISSHCPDLIVLDLGLPDMDGIEVLKSVRKWSNLPVVVVSARQHENDKVEALEFNVRPDAKCVNIPLKDLKLLKNMLIIGIIRGRKVITPSGLTEILPGDRVVVITTNKGLGDLSDILQK